MTEETVNKAVKKVQIILSPGRFKVHNYALPFMDTQGEVDANMFLLDYDMLPVVLSKFSGRTQGCVTYEKLLDGFQYTAGTVVDIQIRVVLDEISRILARMDKKHSRLRAYPISNHFKSWDGIKFAITDDSSSDTFAVVHTEIHTAVNIMHEMLAKLSIQPINILGSGHRFENDSDDGKEIHSILRKWSTPLREWKPVE